MQIGNGNPYTFTYETSVAPEETMQRFYLGTSGVSEYTTAQVGPGSMLLTRRFWPVWVIVVAVLGTLLCLIGFLLLLYRETETLTVAVTETPNGSLVSVSGVVSNEMAGRLQGIIASLPPVPAVPAAPAVPGRTDVPASPPPAPASHAAPQADTSSEASRGDAAPRLCPSGHALAGTEQFCPTCGAPVA